MASIEHCLYCFEALTAHLEGRKSMSLAEVEKSYAEYIRSGDAGIDADDGELKNPMGLTVIKKHIPVIRRLANSSSSNTSSPSSGSSVSLSTDTPDTSTSSLPTDVDRITESPLFVTWNTVVPRTGDVQLRGCIGTFQAQDLDYGLSSYAVTSAIHDMRFDPISMREVPSLEVAVTLLTDFEECEHPMDWDIGKHGLRIKFTDRGGSYNSTYLPDVASEQGWNKEQTLVSLMQKAGWRGRSEKWKTINLDVVRYQGKKEELRYPAFKQWRDWVNKQDNA